VAIAVDVGIEVEVELGVDVEIGVAVAVGSEGSVALEVDDKGAVKVGIGPGAIDGPVNLHALSNSMIAAIPNIRSRFDFFLDIFFPSVDDNKKHLRNPHPWRSSSKRSWFRIRSCLRLWYHKMRIRHTPKIA